MAHSENLLIAPYSAAWPALFEAERLALANVVAPAFCLIEHIGSTAVPDLPSKPIIDMLLGVRSLHEVEIRVDAIERLGYEYIPRHERVMPERRYFAKPVIRPRQFHLHAVVLDGAFWHEHLMFRNALRSSQELARHYASLKFQLAAEFGDDREGYTNAKGPFISSVIHAVSLDARA
jgi:GrpB-like predicted nucleotidyltransferase (UPF0157 family)